MKRRTNQTQHKIQDEEMMKHNPENGNSEYYKKGSQDRGAKSE